MRHPLLGPTSLSCQPAAVQDAGTFETLTFYEVGELELLGHSAALPALSHPRLPASSYSTRELTAPTTNVQAYNSIFNNDPNTPRLIGNFPLLPLRTKTRGPAYTLPLVSLPAYEAPDPDDESYDILDEVLALFRANTFFRNFEIQGPADRLLVYGIWFVSDCLTKIKPKASAREAQKDVMNLALDSNFAIPGDPAWPLNQVGSPRAHQQMLSRGNALAVRLTSLS